MRVHRSVTRALLLLAAFAIPHSLFADDCVWNGTGDWTDPARWTACGGSFPGAADNATVSSGSVTLTGSQAVTNLTFSSGSIVGAGNLAVGGAFAWTGGTMGGTGTTTIASGATMTTNGNTILSRVLTNNGTVTHATATMFFTNGTLENNAAFVAQPDSSLANNGGTNAFNNNASGTFTRNTGTGNFDVNIPFTNAGTVTVSTGTLRLAGGGSSTGTITAPSGTALHFNNSYDVTAGTLTVAGTLSINAGTINMTPATYTVTGQTNVNAAYNLNKASAASNWAQSSGTLGGSGVVTISSGKTYDWTGGTIGGTGTMTIASGATMTTNGNTILSRVLTNNGTVTHATATMFFTNGTLENNAAFVAQPDSSLANNGGTNAFNNNASGTFTRNTGTGNFDVNIPFTNAGTVTVSTGTLRLAGGGSSTGTITAPSGTALHFNNSYDVTAGTLTVAGTLSINAGTINMTPATYTVTGQTNVNAAYNLNKASAASNWAQSSGTLGGSGVVTISSGKTYDWTGGTIGGTGTMTIASGGTMTTNGNTILSRVLTNNGTVTHATATMFFTNGTLENNAAFVAQPDSSLANNGGTNAFNNNASGTFTRNTGTGNFDVNIPFTNAGTVTVSTGTLRLAGGGSSTGTITAPSGTALHFNNSYDVTAGTLTVAGTLSINAGTINMTPATYTVTGQTNVNAAYNLNKASAASNWAQSSGTLGGSGVVTISSGKTYDWTGGTIGGTGTMTIASGGTMTTNGNTILSRVLTNNGNFNQVGGTLFFTNGTFNNNVTFNAQSDSSMANNGGTNAFNNNASGTFTRNTGTGNFDVNIPFTNAGTVNASSGTLRFQGVFTQTAGFTILNGGDVASSSGLNIQGGTLKGSGTITGNVFNGGTVAPGASPGSLTVNGNFSQTAAGTLAVELNGLTAGTQYDQIVVNGTVALAGALTVTSGFTPSQGDGFLIIANDVTDAEIGVFTGLPESSVVNGGAENYRVTYLGGTGNDVVLRAGPAASAQALDVDPVAGGGGDGDGVFEPGETVQVEPTWKNEASNAINLTGSASNFAGPGGSLYTIPDAAAAYGTINPGAAVGCLALSNCFSLQTTKPATRPVTHWDATFTETPSTLADPPKVWTLHLGDSFSDVPRTQLFYRRIETLVHTGMTSGCGPGTYCPTDAVNRAQMGIFLAKGIAGGGPNVPVSGSFQGSPYNCSNGGTSLFTDVTPTDIFCKHVHYMAVQNVTLGCGGGQYCPAGTITRADMAIFVAKALAAPQGGPGVPETYTDPVTHLSYSCAAGSPNLHFTDIKVTDTFCKHVHFLWAKNIVSGCSGAGYCPTQGVTRDQMARFLGNAFNLVLYAP